MKNKFLDNYSMAKFITYEVFYEAQMQQAGSRQAKFLEKCQNNNKYIRNMVILLKCLSSFFIIFLPLIYLISLPGVLDVFRETTNIDSKIIAYGIVCSVFSVSYMTYLFIFGLYTLGAYMSGESFKWLRTMPISKKKLRTYAFMTLFRSIDLQLIALTVGLPIVVTIVTLNPVMLIISFLVSIPNTIFCLFLLIFMGERLSRILFNKENISKKANKMKMAVMAAIIVLSISMNLILQMILLELEGFMEFFNSSNDTPTWNLILSLVPYPFAPNYFISLFTSPASIPPLLWITTIIGFSFFLCITYFIAKRALNSIKSIVGTKKKRKSIRKEKKVELLEPEIQIKKTGIINAYIRKDLTSVSRDLQSAMFIIMPILYSFIMVFSFTGGLSEISDLEIQVMGFWFSSMLLISTMNPLMLVSGLMNIEETGATITAALPIHPRDQAKAKLTLMITIQIISFLPPAVIASIIFQNIWILIITLCSLPLTISFLFIAFMMKVFLFGKMKYKYVTEEIIKEKKIRKWLLIVGTNLGLVLLHIAFFLLLGMIFDVWALCLLILFIGGTILCVLLVGFDKIFPRLHQMEDYETGGALRNNPILGATALILIYWLLPFVIGFPIESIFLFFEMNAEISFYIRFALSFSIMAFIWLVIAPKWLKLPYEQQNINTYFKNIKLHKKQPIVKNILIGIISFLIIIIPILLGSNLLGIYEFNPNILIQKPLFTNFIYFLGWFIFIFMLFPAIWEEMIFRGLMIPMFKKRYSNLYSILLSGVFFGIFHILNLVPAVVQGLDPIIVLLQMIFATFLGFALAYIYLSTDSLIPCMVFHYIYDVFIILITPIAYNDLISQIIFNIFFLGIIPMILIVLFVKLIKNKDILNESLI